MNNKKRRILHELGLKKTIEDNTKRLSQSNIDLERIASEYWSQKALDQRKENKTQEVILNEYN